MKLEALSLRRASLLLGTALLTGIAGFAGSASAMSLQEAIGLVISTNPEVGVTVKDRRAIDYELRQARALYYPQIDVRLDAGIDFSENETTDTGNDRTNQGVHDHGRWLYGRRDAQVTLQQTRARREVDVRGEGTEEDQVEVARREVRLAERLTRGVDREVGRPLILRHEVPLPDSRALLDPLVAGVHALGEIGVGDDLRRDAAAHPGDVCVGHAGFSHHSVNTAAPHA